MFAKWKSLRASENILPGRPDDRRGRHRTGRLLGMGMGLLTVLAAAWSGPREGNGQDATGLPSGKDPIKTAPFDRITLTDGSVINVDPISPRPLPPPETAKEKRAKIRARDKTIIPPEGNIGLPGEKSKVETVEEAKAKEEEEDRANEVIIHLLEGEIRDFKVDRNNIKAIEYFEDMLLAEARRLILARDYTRAFEASIRVQARNPGWPGLDDVVNRILFEEGSAALLENDGEGGLRLLRELHARRPDFPGLADKLAAAYGDRIARAFEMGAYMRGRRGLHELEGLAPEHLVVRSARARFIAKAQGFVKDSARGDGPARLDALTEAVRIWPALEGAGPRFAQAFAAEPTLDVAVTDLPRSLGPWTQSSADERVSRLLYLPVLDVARDGDEESSTRGGGPGGLAAGLETVDLGRRLVLRVRQDVTWSDGSRPVSAIDVARALTERTVPSSPGYNARWADLLDRIESPDASRIEIRLTRPHLRPSAWLTFPVGPAHAGPDGWVATLDQGRQLVGDGPFRLASASKGQVRLRTPGEGTSPGSLRVRRLHEVRPASSSAAIGALVRGEVSLVEHVPADRVASLAADPEIKVGRFTRPNLHRIALDGRTLSLRNRALRRGLSYAIDRKSLLEETLLRRPSDEINAVADGPFPKGSYADAPDVKPLGYDPLLARMLIAAARKELGGPAIKLTLDYPATNEARSVVPKIVDALRLVGVEIVAVERPEADLEAGLRAGGRFDLAYLSSPCVEPALDAGPLISPGYDAAPEAGALGSVVSPRILQLLLQLERAPEWATARGMVRQVDRESRDELPILPLWQLEGHYAWRTRLKGPPEATDHLYQGIETWEIEPWFAKDPW